MAPHAGRVGLATRSPRGLGDRFVSVSLAGIGVDCADQSFPVGRRLRFRIRGRPSNTLRIGRPRSVLERSGQIGAPNVNGPATGASGATSLETGPEVGFRLPHAFPTFRHRRSKVGSKRSDRAGEIARDALGRVPAHRLPNEPGDPERHAEAEPDAHQQPEEALEHRLPVLVLRLVPAQRPVGLRGA